MSGKKAVHVPPNTPGFCLTRSAVLLGLARHCGGSLMALVPTGTPPWWALLGSQATARRGADLQPPGSSTAFFAAAAIGFSVQWPSTWERAGRRTPRKW